MTTTPPPARRSGLAIADLVIAVLLALIGGVIGLAFLGYLGQLSGVSDACEGVAPDGVRCAPAFLNGMQIVGYAIVVFAWAITTGFIVVRFIRRKAVFFLPLLAVAIMIAGFYLVVTVVSTSYLPPS
jgi:purine-cytosine permease-like protein